MRYVWIVEAADGPNWEDWYLDQAFDNAEAAAARAAEIRQRTDNGWFYHEAIVFRRVVQS